MDKNYFQYFIWNNYDCDNNIFNLSYIGNDFFNNLNNNVHFKDIIDVYKYLYNVEENIAYNM